MIKKKTTLKTMIFNKIFVTVGTTEFNTLMETINTPEMAKILKDVQCKELTVQTGGTGKLIQFNESDFKDINIKVYNLKKSILPDIKAADLVISHAGAGSCIEILTVGKPLVVVVNNLLMENHQLELAEQLANDEYLAYCVPQTLHQTLRELDVKKFRKYEPGKVKDFVKHLDEFMGFA